MLSSIRPDLYGEDRLLKGREGVELSPVTLLNLSL